MAYNPQNNNRTNFRPAVTVTVGRQPNPPVRRGTTMALSGPSSPMPQRTSVQTDDQNQIKALKERVVALEAEVARLKRQLATAKPDLNRSSSYADGDYPFVDWETCGIDFENRVVKCEDGIKFTFAALKKEKDAKLMR